MEVIKFGSDDLENRLASDPSRAELLPFGAILVNQQGDVLRFNQVESGISGRTVGDVVGKNFFNDIAPCAKGQIFYNHFFRAVAEGQINTMFDYQFDYKMTATNVRIHMKSADAASGIWIFIKRV
ncbi:photoactive yellow protein [uncultured Sphingomonas sp.]|uniref:photoactive yellow protein n=1 Tax=uncultured Sphingomonas sp. TaxID=158754 RepID=UPI0035CA8E14